MRRLALHLRMLVAVLGLLAVSVGLLCVAVVAGVLLVATFVARPAADVANPWAVSLRVGAALGAVGFLALSVRELRRADSLVPRRFDAREPTGAERERLAPRVRRFASRFDVPTPTVRVAETDAPHVSVSGLSPRRTTLVVSTAVLAALDGPELDAVVAHEIAHVANRDAAVCTLVSTPSAVAHAVLTYDPGVEPPGQYRPVNVTIYDIVGGFFYALGRPLVSVFARQREYAADAAAVAATGNPGALASALETLSDRARTAPTEDVRAGSPVAAFSIVRPPSVTDEEYRTDSAGPSLVGLWERAVATHPPVEKRIDRLADLADGATV
ncbi:M48 family metalloprotease [Halorussus sp. AFM4]|uniref:M48 family metalloprotease n=1 Tax=Halorussus sp. AFM4 TaxID=3421651 RepID=UPI003EB69A80